MPFNYIWLIQTSEKYMLILLKYAETKSHVLNLICLAVRVYTPGERILGTNKNKA